MSADFWAGYISGAAGIIIGNPLDLIKTRLQAGDDSIHATSSESLRGTFDRAGTLVRGATAPILGYGALNGLLYYTYNRSLLLLGSSTPSSPPSLPQVWTAGAIGGFASFIVSAPTELIKCRAQVSRSSGPSSSLTIAKEIWSQNGLRGLYFGGGVTSIRDAVGYGFYFWSYEISKRALRVDDRSLGEGQQASAMKILLAGGLAGVVTWASIFPLDVIKTRVQTQNFAASPSAIVGEQAALLHDHGNGETPYKRRGAIEIARMAYRDEGWKVFFRGLGICSVRAFIVNAVQWTVYEWMMRVLAASPDDGARKQVDVVSL